MRSRGQKAARCRHRDAMRGCDRDDWPKIFEQVLAADILVLLSPIWLGEKSSVCTQVIEWLYGNNSHLLNDAGQWAYYGRVGWTRERLHQPQYHLAGLEPDASGADAQGRGRHPGPRQSEEPVGCRMPLRLRQPRLPLSRRGHPDDAGVF